MQENPSAPGVAKTPAEHLVSVQKSIQAGKKEGEVPFGGFNAYWEEKLFLCVVASCFVFKVRVFVFYVWCFMFGLVFFLHILSLVSFVIWCRWVLLVLVLSRWLARVSTAVPRAISRLGGSLRLVSAELLPLFDRRRRGFSRCVLVDVVWLGQRLEKLIWFLNDLCWGLSLEFFRLLGIMFF